MSHWQFLKDQWKTPKMVIEDYYQTEQLFNRLRAIAIKNKISIITAKQLPPINITTEQHTSVISEGNIKIVDYIDRIEFAKKEF